MGNRGPNLTLVPPLEEGAQGKRLPLGLEHCGRTEWEIGSRGG